MNTNSENGSRGLGRLIAIAFVALLGFARAAVLDGFTGATLYVDAANPEVGDGSAANPYRTIQSAVDTAKSGDRIEIAGGTYDSGSTASAFGASRVEINKRLYLKGAGRDKTVIVGEEGIRGIAVRSAAADSLIEGVTVRDADIEGDGGGVFGETGTRFYLVDGSIVNCRSVGYGGAISAGAILIRMLIDSCTSTTANYGAIQGIAGAYNLVAVGNGIAGTHDTTCPAVAAGTYGPFVNCTFVSNGSHCFARQSGYGNVRLYNSIMLLHSMVGLEQGGQNMQYSATTHNGQASNNQHNFGGDDPATHPGERWLTSGFILVSPLTDWHLLDGAEVIDQGNDEFCALDFIPEEYRDTDYYGNVRIQGSCVDMGAAEGGFTPNCGRVFVDTKSSYGNIRVNGRRISRNEATGLHRFYISALTYPSGVEAQAVPADDESFFCYRTTYLNTYRSNQGVSIFPDIRDRTVFALPKADVAVTNTPVFTKNILWVDKDKGSDSNAGTDKDLPMETIQGAVDACTASTSGDPKYYVIRVAPGTYDKGGKTMTCDSDDTAVNKTKNRVHIEKKYVRLIGTEGAEKTVIMGAATDDETVDFDGCGPDAYRCVQVNCTSDLNVFSCVQGFTLTGGRTCADPTNPDYERPGKSGNLQSRSCYGGGAWLCGTWNNHMVNGVLRDCIVSNNVAYWGSATYGGLIQNCVFTDNRNVTSSKDPAATKIDCAFLNGVLSACLAYGNTSKMNISDDQTRLFNCTIYNSPGCRADKFDTIMNNATDTGDAVSFRCPAEGDFHVVSGGMTATAVGENCPKYATLSLDGKMFAYANPYLAGCYAERSDRNLYVDATNGDDENDGLTRSAPKRTLNAILSKAQSGDTVHAAEGVYADNAMLHDSAKETIPFVGIVPDGVTLSADGAQGRTIVKGRWGGVGGSGNPYYTKGYQNMTFGEDAIRCLWAGANAKIKGFTICNGGTLHTKRKDGSDTAAEDFRGAGVYGTSTTVYEDCFFSNCVAYTQAAFYGGGTAIRCKFVRIGADIAGITSGGWFYNCYFDRCFDAPVNKAKAVKNCTFGPNMKIGFGVGSSYENSFCGTPLSMNTADDPLENTMQLSKSGSAAGGLQTFNGAKNCIFVKDNLEAKYTVPEGKGNRFLTLDEVPLGTEGTASEGRPLAGSLAIDAGDNALLEEDKTAGVDLGRGARIYNGTVDVGAYEYDFRKDYAAALKCSRLEVTAVSPDVQMSGGGVHIGANAFLVASVIRELPNGATIRASVSGNGVLLIESGSGTAWSMKAGDPELNLACKLSVGETLRFTYVPDPGDASAAGATISKITSNIGLLLIVQ